MSKEKIKPIKYIAHMTINDNKCPKKYQHKPKTVLNYE